MATTPQPEGASIAPPPAQDPAANLEGILIRTHKGAPIPTTDFIGLGGKAMTLAAFKGRPLLLNLWATWCAPCIAEMPSLDALAQRDADRLQILSISQDMAGKAAVTPWWAAHRLQMLQPYLDPELHMMAALNDGDPNAGALPTSVLYDKNGKEVWRMTGGMNWNSPHAAALLNEVIGK